MRQTKNPLFFVVFSAILAFTLVSCREAPQRAPEASEATAQAQAEPVMCDVELRSFIVAGRGRHLYLLIDCPSPYDEFDGRVEYTTAAYRSDYTAPADRSGAARVAKMTRGRSLYPIVANADDRLEARFEVTLEQAICLQQDRVFSARYALLGTNSSSGLRRAVEACDCELPVRLVTRGGMFGDFPGIDQDPGPVIDRDRWLDYGVEGEPPLVLPGADLPPAGDSV